MYIQTHTCGNFLFIHALIGGSFNNKRKSFVKENDKKCLEQKLFWSCKNITLGYSKCHQINLNAPWLEQRSVIKFLRAEKYVLVNKKCLQIGSTWLYHYESESKRQFMEWKYTHALAKKFQIQWSLKKVMLILFWDMKGSITIDFFEKIATGNSSPFCQLLW